MSTQHTSESAVSRRGFVAGAAATVALSAAAGSQALAAEASAGKDATASAAADKDVAPAGTPSNRWQSEASAAWQTAPAPVADADIADGGTFDVVVVGGGQTGTWFAKYGARNGLKVCVIESQAQDMHLYIGGEVGTINCPWALEHGATEIDPQDFMREVYRRNQGRSNQRIIKAYVDHSGQFLQDVIDELPEGFMDEHGMHVSTCPPDERIVMDPSGYKFYLGTVIFRDPDMPLTSWRWQDVMTLACEDSQASGAEWHFSTHAEYLEKDADGRVVAVVAKDVDDESYTRFTASKGVVLTGGDFAGNVDMLRDINDEYRHLAESLGDIELAASAPMVLPRDGSAIAMGVWAGGHIEVGPHAGMNTGQSGPEAPWGPGYVMLNQNGKRFCDECAGGAEGSAYMVPRQPKGSVVAIADANWQDLVYSMPPCHESVDYRREQGWPKTVESMEAVKPGEEPTTAIAYSSEPDVYCAETLEDLVRIVGCWSEDEQAAALEELKRYQEMAAAGQDDDFAKDPRILAVSKLDTPPFYAVVGSTTAMNPGLCQTTGLDIDDEHHVLDFDLRPIPGLFAAGNNAGNRFVVQYSTPLSGMSLGFCLTEGRLLAEGIADGSIA